MGFIDENGYPLINEEQKIRIALSNRAKLTMAEDMDVFGTPRSATFVNTVFNNFKSEAKSSISLYLQQREIELDRLFTGAKLDAISKKIAIDQIISVEKKEFHSVRHPVYSERCLGFVKLCSNVRKIHNITVTIPFVRTVYSC